MPSEADNFLNVMQIMDYDDGTGRPLKTEMIETDKFVGVKLSDRIILFSRDGELNDSSVSIKISGDGFYKVLIADMTTGSWKVESKGDKKSPEYKVNKISHLLSFTASKGDYNISLK
jgi:hypothetical protein